MARIEITHSTATARNAHAEAVVAGDVNHIERQADTTESDIVAHVEPVVNNTVEVLSSSVIAKVSVNVTGMPDLDHKTLNSPVVPNFVLLTYSYQTSRDSDGWTTHTWRCPRAEVRGSKILKPGPDGQRRVSELVGGTALFDSYAADVNTRDDTPEWLFELIEELRPSGSVCGMSL